MKRYIENELNEEELEMIQNGNDKYLYFGKDIEENELQKIEKEIEKKYDEYIKEKYELNQLTLLYEHLKIVKNTEDRKQIIKEANQTLNNSQKIKDTDIHKKFGIPISTLQDWKKRNNDNWRKKIYLYLKKEVN